MSSGGEAADQMVREGLQVMETSAKIAGAGVQSAAAIIAALAKDNPKLRGRTKLNRLLKEGKELKVFSLKKEDLHRFKNLAQTYGVLFVAVKDKQNGGEFLDILAKAEDVGKLNRIFERMGYAVPKEKTVSRKKAPTRSPLGSASMLRESGVKQTKQKTTTNKESVRAALSRMKNLIAEEKAAKEDAMRDEIGMPSATDIPLPTPKPGQSKEERE